MEATIGMFKSMFLESFVEVLISCLEETDDLLGTNSTSSNVIPIRIYLTHLYKNESFKRVFLLIRLKLQHSFFAFQGYPFILLIFLKFMTIRIITDSASDLPWDFAKKNNIKIVSLYVMVHEEVLVEDENFNRASYYQLFEDEKAFFHIPQLKLHSFVPSTSQPSPKDFMDAYQAQVDEGAKELIVITVTAGLSGTFNSANLAAKQFARKNKDIKIHIIDAKSASYPEVILIRMALKLIEKKYDGEKIAKILNEQAIKIKTVILLPTLRYLWKGGRLGSAKFLLGSMLRKKPIVTMTEEGKVITAGSASDVESGLQESLRLSTEDFAKKPKAFTIVYGSNLEYAERMAEIIKEKYPKVSIEIAQSGGSVLSHLGPESIGTITDFTDDEL